MFHQHQQSINQLPNNNKIFFFYYPKLILSTNHVLTYLGNLIYKAMWRQVGTRKEDWYER